MDTLRANAADQILDIYQYFYDKLLGDQADKMRVAAALTQALLSAQDAYKMIADIHENVVGRRSS